MAATKKCQVRKLGGKVSYSAYNQGRVYNDLRCATGTINGKAFFYFAAVTPTIRGCERNKPEYFNQVERMQIGRAYHVALKKVRPRNAANYGRAQYENVTRFNRMNGQVK